ncbi:MAG: hypothetical protein IJX27_02250 [Clostridia bacterium]|nr:hypothetical protein [Clostridia bacterium]
MKIHGRKRIFSNPFWVNLRNHFCPYCDEIVNITTESKVVNSKSPEAKDFDFSDACGDVNMVGNIKFTWTAFECPVCKRRFSVDEMKKLENDENNKRPQSAYRKTKFTFSELAPLIFSVLLFVGVILFLVICFTLSR